MDKMLFVWDFHGTLETGNVNAVQQLVNLVLAESELNTTITIEQAKQWYGLSWFDYFKLAVPDGDNELWQAMVDKVLSLQERGWNIIKQHIRLREFAEEVIKEIKNQGHHSIVLSNTRPEHIQTFTDTLGITPYFESLIGIDNHENATNGREAYETKSEALADFLRNKNYQKIVLIGDAESDIKAGKLQGAITYLVADRKSETFQADYVISDLREVLREIQEYKPTYPIF